MTPSASSQLAELKKTGNRYYCAMVKKEQQRFTGGGVLCAGLFFGQVTCGDSRKSLC